MRGARSGEDLSICRSMIALLRAAGLPNDLQVSADLSSVDLHNLRNHAVQIKLFLIVKLEIRTICEPR